MKTLLERDRNKIYALGVSWGSFLPIVVLILVIAVMMVGFTGQASAATTGATGATATAAAAETAAIRTTAAAAETADIRTTAAAAETAAIRTTAAAATRTSATATTAAAATSNPLELKLPITQRLSGDGDLSGCSVTYCLTAEGANASKAPMPDGSQGGTYRFTISGSATYQLKIPYSGTGEYRYSLAADTDGQEQYRLDSKIYDLYVAVATRSDGSLRLSYFALRRDGNKSAEVAFYNTYLGGEETPSEPDDNTGEEPGAVDPGDGSEGNGSGSGDRGSGGSGSDRDGSGGSTNGTGAGLGNTSSNGGSGDGTLADENGEDGDFAGSGEEAGDRSLEGDGSQNGDMNVANGDDLNKGFHLWPFVLAALVLALLGLLAGLYGIAVVDGGAMGATFAAGKWLLFAKKKQELHRGDLVAAKIDGKKLVRRIIGMPGETVTVEAGGRVLIKTAAVTTDGTVSGTTAGTAARTSAGTTAGTVALEEPYVVGTPNLLGLAQVQTVLDDDSYLLLADNRQHMVVTSGLRATPKGDIKGKIHTNKHHKFSI